MVALAIALPSLVLPATGYETAQIVLLIAFGASLFTFFEYFAAAPSFVEFRATPPFNRIRFQALFVMVLLVSLHLRGQTDASTLTRLVTAVAERLASAIDFPYSPVRLIVLMLPQTADPGLMHNLRAAAAVCYAVSFGFLIHFVIMMRVSGWPVRRKGFNIWINLPTFDPTTGGDVVTRLNRDAQINLILGFLLPFVIPAVMKMMAELSLPVSLADRHTLIWTIAAWAFLPMSLIMRGLALLRVTQIITWQRKQFINESAEGLRTA